MMFSFCRSEFVDNKLSNEIIYIQVVISVGQFKMNL